MALENIAITGVTVGFTDAQGAAQTITLDGEGKLSAESKAAAKTLGFKLKRTSKAASKEWRIMATPTEGVKITSLVATLSAPMEMDTPLYLNGYESWTDSHERPAFETMLGLTRVPRFIVDKWVLDGSGDYRFTTYDTRRGHSHGWEYGYVRHGESVALVGSLNVDSGFTLLRADATTGTITLEKEVPNRALATGEELELMSFGLYEDTLDKACGAWLKSCGITALPATPLVGFTSWYRHYGDITEVNITADLDGVATELAADKLNGKALPLFQIDDGFAPVGDWLLPHKDRFPRGMKPLVEAIESKGLVPGLWLAPFVCENTSEVFTKHGSWIMRDERGEIVYTGCNWPGACALDTRNPEVRAYIQEFLHTVTADWGFKLLKLDFLFAACMIPHDGMNRGELMADALELIRSSIAPGTTTIMCGVPMVSSFGRTEYCRVGCDVSLDWDDKLYMRPLHRERVSSKRSLANSRGRAHLDGKAFRCDPDVLLLRHDVKLTEDQRNQLIEADEKLGGVLLTSDDMGAWDNTQRATWRQAVANFLAKE